MELFNNIDKPQDGWTAQPTAPEKKARAKKAKVELPDTFSARMYKALSFLSVASRDKGTDQQTHCFIGNHIAVAFDGVIAAGIAVEADLYACPRTGPLLAAFDRGGADLAITQLAADRLLVRSGDFQAAIPCLAPERLTAAFPDAPCGIIDDRLREALAVVEGLVKDNAQHVTSACVLLRSKTVVGTDGEVILEAFHGIDLPPMLVPKAALAAIKKIKKPLARFGFSPTTATFYFDDNSWIRTQLYVERYGDLDSILNTCKRNDPIPEHFFAAIADAANFSPDGSVYCGDGRVMSHAPHATKVQGSQLFNSAVAGVSDMRVYFAKNVAIMAKYAAWMDDKSRPNTTFFGNAKVRGAIGFRTIKPKVPTIQQATAGPYSAGYDHCTAHAAFTPGCDACVDANIPF